MRTGVVRLLVLTFKGIGEKPARETVIPLMATLMIMVAATFARSASDLLSDITGVSINTALGRMRYALINIRKMSVEKGIALTIAE